MFGTLDSKYQTLPTKKVEINSFGQNQINTNIIEQLYQKNYSKWQRLPT